MNNKAQTIHDPGSADFRVCDYRNESLRIIRIFRSADSNSTLDGASKPPPGPGLLRPSGTFGAPVNGKAAEDCRSPRRSRARLNTHPAHSPEQFA